MWSTAAEALSVMAHRPHLKRTLVTAVVVGTILFGINQLDVLIATRRPSHRLQDR